jgi:hypothetical protein
MYTKKVTHLIPNQLLYLSSPLQLQYDNRQQLGAAWDFPATPVNREIKFPDMPLIIPCYFHTKTDSWQRKMSKMKCLPQQLARMRRSNLRNSLYFSLLAGNFYAEKGSHVTASSASNSLLSEKYPSARAIFGGLPDHAADHNNLPTR